MASEGDTRGCEVDVGGFYSAAGASIVPARNVRNGRRGGSNSFPVYNHDYGIQAFLILNIWYSSVQYMHNVRIRLWYCIGGKRNAHKQVWYWSQVNPGAC